MEKILAVFVGIVTFLLIFVLKPSLKKKAYAETEEVRAKKYIKIKMLHIRRIFLALFMSVSVYYVICLLAGVHHKLCCSFKAWVIALALYAVYKQFFLTEYDCSY